MNDDFLLQYLLQQGAMEPERAALERRQATVDALRKRGMDAPEGQMVGRTYVRPSLTQYAAQFGNALAARNAQSQLDQDYNSMAMRSRMPLQREADYRSVVKQAGTPKLETLDPDWWKKLQYTPVNFGG